MTFILLGLLITLLLFFMLMCHLTVFLDENLDKLSEIFSESLSKCNA